MFYNEEDQFATKHEADLEYVNWVGAEDTTTCWLLSDRDVWYKNPHFVGEETTHPETYDG